MAQLCYFLLTLSVLSAIISSANGLNIQTKKLCCNLGISGHSSSSGASCNNLRISSAAVAKSDEKACSNIADVCCKKEEREKQCKVGQSDAMSGASCQTDDGERKNCCEACQTGIDSGKAKESCQDGSLFGPQYDSIFTSCCEEASKETTTSTTTTSTTPAPYNFAKPEDSGYAYTSMENICESDICAQICIPTDGSFRCDCNKGYILMEDGISCKPVKRALKKGGRCEVNNPCDQDCIDTGTAIKCSCREGYELADDKRTCKDIDECFLKLDDCGRNEECINEIGTFVCYENTFLEEPNNNNFTCPPGYKYNFEAIQCDDIDECEFDLMCEPPNTCKNTVGSFICERNTPQCPPGFHYKAAIDSCTDIDECLTGEHNCNKESQLCLNSKGNYTCVDKVRHTCPPGFKKNIATQLCEDVNECEEEPELCKEDEDCVNEPGAHSCIPKKNYSKPPTTPHYKTEVYKTTTAKHIHVPVSCPRGYKYATENNACIDINECIQESNVCASNEICVNSIGSFTCSCNTGFSKDVTGACLDINECQLNHHNCKVAERCDNTVGSYHCIRIHGCGTGYTLNYANGLCEDDDECQLGSHNCNKLGPNFKCTNLVGSYRCELKKKTPQQPLVPAVVLPLPTPRTTIVTTRSTTITPATTLSTTTRTTRHPTTTATVTKSTTASVHSSFYARTHPIPPLPQLPPKPLPYDPITSPPWQGYSKPFEASSTSSYTPYTYTRTINVNQYLKPYYTTAEPVRSYPNNPFLPRIIPTQKYPMLYGQTKKCLPGYVMDAKGDCKDVDECQSNPCRRHEKCLNFNGRYECASPMQCKYGFELNDAGDMCIDVNECTRGTHRCGSTQICKNGQGYYTCECPPGHHLSAITETCEDLDECKFFRPCSSNANCINTKGSYKCECKDGFKTNNLNFCDDIDECEQQQGLCDHNCVNTWGSFRCSCRPGFTLNLDNRTCADIDECERFKDKRLCVGTCRNVPGSYSCDCPKGYKLGSDGRGCIDIDECRQSNPCNSEDVCLNTRGGYKCYEIKCPKNYAKDSEHRSRCKRADAICRDYECLRMPEQYTYQYMTFVSNLPLQNGEIQLLQIKGPQWNSGRAEFKMSLVDVSCPFGVSKVDESYFRKINNHVSSMKLLLVRSIQGPQEIKLQIEMHMYQGNIFIGNVVAYIIIVVSEYPF